MTVEIREEPPAALADYGRVPIAFEVSERLVILAAAEGLGGLHLTPDTVDPPYVKDYDSDPDNRPTTWPARFDVSRWGILAAWADGERLGGAVAAWDTPGLDLLEGRRDLTVLWDLRVSPAWRRHGVGTALFRAAEAWALAHGARWLKVERRTSM